MNARTVTLPARTAEHVLELAMAQDERTDWEHTALLALAAQLDRADPLPDDQRRTTDVIATRAAAGVGGQW